MSRFWVLGLALLVAALAFGIGSRQAIAVTTIYATKAFVLLAIQAFDQNVVQPIAARVTDLEGDVVVLDQRVADLEDGATPPDVVTDRALVVDQAGPPWITHLIDTDDGSLIASYDDAVPAGSSCDGKRAVVINEHESSPKSWMLIDGVTGQVIRNYDNPPGLPEVVSFSCRDVALLLSGLNVVHNRAALVYSGNPVVVLIDTESGDVVTSYVATATDVNFSCSGDSFLIARFGIFSSMSGAMVKGPPELGQWSSFLCDD